MNVRFLRMLKADHKRESGMRPKPAPIERSGRLAEELRTAGVLVDVRRFLQSSAWPRGRATGGTVTVTDGPFAETNEVVGG